MELPLIGGDLDFEEWFRGLIAAFIGGGASAVAGGITVSALDPRDYNFQSGVHKLFALMGAMFLVNGVLNMMMFLRQKPVPEHRVVRTTVAETTTKPGPPATTVVRTVEETHTEPKPQ